MAVTKGRVVSVSNVMPVARDALFPGINCAFSSIQFQPEDKLNIDAV